MSRKKIITIISLLIVVVLSVSGISYSIATQGNKSKQSTEIETDLNQYGAGSTYKSNIDLIIQNSNLGDDAKTFNIVQIAPKDNYNDAVTNGDLSKYKDMLSLAKYIKSGSPAKEYFKDYVFDANKSKSLTEKMASDKILLDVVPVDNTTSLDAEMTSNITGASSKIIDVLNNADLIYVTSPIYKSYNSNMSEDVYNFLHTYAVGKNKPIIVDYVRTSDKEVVSGDSTTYKALVNEIRGNWKKYNTFQWPAGQNAIDFFSSKGKSYYVKYSSASNMGEDKKAPVLVISDSPNDSNTMYQRFKAAVDSNVNNLVKEMYYTPDKPTDFNITVKTSSEIASDVLNSPEGVGILDGYDYIFLEKDLITNGKTMSKDVYTKLKSLSESSKYILIDYDSSTYDDENSSYEGTNNYLKLTGLLLSSTGMAKQSNVLSVRYGFFTSLYNAGENSGATAKYIADIINSSIYRDSDKNGEATRKYKVLEIEPCYPIDLELATSQKDSSNVKYPVKGSYYNVPDQVRYGVTTDEIEEGTEYYAFDISKAKIAHATGIPYNQIEVDQVSANELISTKSVIAENYDLVYIGGDKSAFVPYKLKNYSGGEWNNGQWGNAGTISTVTSNFTSFDMYSHTGTFANYGAQAGQNNKALYSVENQSNVIEFNGNDINTIKRDELKEYVDMGLPIIIDKVVKDAFEESYQYDPDNEDSTNKNRLNQLGLHEIDPDSNMYQFLAYAYQKSKKNADNVSWGDIDTNAADATQVVSNANRSYGNTLSSDVTVFKTDYEKVIRKLLGISESALAGENASIDISSVVKRPKLVLKDSPMEYVEGDDSSTNYGTTVSFEVDSSVNQGCVYKLYVDADGDGIFSESEVKATYDPGTATSGNKDKLTFGLSKGFFGIINWKVKVINESTELCDTITGCSLFKEKEKMNKEVRVLQIMPVDIHQDAFPQYLGLYFCTECQQAYHVLDNNVTIDGNDSGWLGFNSHKERATVCNGVNVGKHEHNFGIVKYDSARGRDEWEDNFADALTLDEDGSEENGEFDFDLDIISHEDFDQMAADAAAYKATKTYDVGGVQMTAQEASEFYGGVDGEHGQVQTALNAAEQYVANLENQLFTAAAAFKGAASDGLAATNQSYYCHEIVEGIGTKDKPGKWILNRKYYKFWEYYNESLNIQVNVPNLDALKAAYNSYIAEYNKVVEYREKVKKYNRLSYDADNWISENYDIVVLGLADKFNYKDLSVTSCNQIKKYVSAGGALLNSHDTMTVINDDSNPHKASTNLTTILRETFGMDRYHVTGLASDVEGQMSAVVTVGPGIANASDVTHNLKGYRVSYLNTNKTFEDTDVNDISITFKREETWDGAKENVVTPLSTSHAADFDDYKVYVTALDYLGNPLKNCTVKLEQYSNYNWQEVKSYSTNDEGKVTIEIPQVLSGNGYITEKSAVITLKNDSNINVEAKWSNSGLAVENVTSNPIAADANKIDVNMTLKLDDGSVVPNGIPVKLKTSNTYEAVVGDGGNVTFEIPTDDFLAGSDGYLTFTGSTKYRKYKTSNASNKKNPNARYFWTQRFKATTDAELITALNNVSGYVNCNAPVGLTDFYTMWDGLSRPKSPYLYAAMSYERIQSGNVNSGNGYEGKYGTRRAVRVNKGGVTLYPFAISDELYISTTHAQPYALDMEDPSVAVWYTLGCNYISGTPTCSADEAYQSSSLFAASPKDGMNNYFLYSRGSVFYTGAGNQMITGANKDNNDERRLFINVIVSSVSKGYVLPDFKLYNKCDKKDDNCDDNYVNPTKNDENDELAKEINTLFYNRVEEMYQYNIDDSAKDVYPEFDFKVIKGTADIKDIKVFYDLNYDEEKTDTYTEDDNHILITSFNKADNMDSVRVRLRENTLKNTLLLKDTYFNDNNCTYIVIHVTDVKGKESSARVKINMIPHLFDLTDATFDFQYQSIVMDVSKTDIIDKSKFNI